MQQAIFAGFGGQGVLLMGQILAKAGMLDGRNVLWIPSYGPEMRGGTANCSVIVSDQPVGSPVIAAGEATDVVVMNLPSLHKFEESVMPGGRLFINTSLIEEKPTRTDITVVNVPVNDIAQELGNARVANMVMLGAFLKATGAAREESVMEALRASLGKAKEGLLPVNRQALARGASAVQV